MEVTCELCGAALKTLNGIQTHVQVKDKLLCIECATARLNIGADLVTFLSEQTKDILQEDATGKITEDCKTVFDIFRAADEVISAVKNLCEERLDQIDKGADVLVTDALGEILDICGDDEEEEGGEEGGEESPAEDMNQW